MIINGQEIVRLIASGCSFCYGDELEDPFNQSWPKQLADMLGIECINLGARGMGNEHIQNSILDYFSLNPTHQKNSFVIPSFSLPSRIEFPRSINRLVENIHWPYVWATVPQAKRRMHLSFVKIFFEEIYDDNYYYARYLRIIILLQSYFQSNKIPYLMFNALTGHQVWHDQHKIIVSLNKSVDSEYFLGFNECKNWTHLLGDEKILNRYLPGKHPSPAGHICMAKLLHNSIKDLYKE